MKQAIFAAVIALTLRCGDPCFGAEPRLEMVSDHCYYLQVEEGGNIAVVITEEGTLMIDPPQGPDLSLTVDALKNSSSKAVRWLIFTDYRFSRTAGTRFFAGGGALMVTSAQLRALSTAVTGGTPRDAEIPGSKSEIGGQEEAPSFPGLIFDRQMHLFPANLEIRVMALPGKARTGGDVFVYVPAEKVLFVGDFYEAARYPDIDTASGGNALEWINGLKQIIDSVPVLKSAIPATKPEPKQEHEPTLEEGILVVSRRGEVTNLQNMKDLLEACQKLRRDISRAVRAKRTCDSFLASRSTDPYRSYANLDAYAARLFEAIAAAEERDRESKH